MANPLRACTAEKVPAKGFSGLTSWDPEWLFRKIMNKLELGALPDSLRTLNIRPLMVINLDVEEPLNVGLTPAYDRRIGIISGGQFEGDRLSGKVLRGGSDWQTVRKDGAWTMNVRIVLKTNDGELIGMTYQGIRIGSPDIMSRLPTGDVDPSEYYFRTTPLFETASAKYSWLNHIIAVGTGHRFPEGPLYSIFEIL